MSIFALVDCNNFYVSCERAFNPRLEKKPIVVLSNNDGCFISRSNEAKALGIPMGAPFFQWKKFCSENNVIVFSSNYELYGDMSERVMQILQENCPDSEIYSIDEAFLQLENFKHQNLTDYAIELRRKVKTWTGIPVSIGFAHTKTLAKVANHIAKTQVKNGVYNLLDPNVQNEILSNFPVEKVWGIGRQLAARLDKLNIKTAKDLRDNDPKKMRRYFSVVMEKMIYELRGFSCIPFEIIQPKKQIISSRSFGKYVTELKELEEAISNHAATAATRLREEGSQTQGISVFIQTNVFSQNEPAYNNSLTASFPLPTIDTGEIISTAIKCVQKLYKKNYKYQKVGIILLDNIPYTIQQQDIFQKVNPSRQKLMHTIDTINTIFGKDTVFHAAQGIQRAWQAKYERRSPRYTTRWDEVVWAKT